VIQWAKKTGDYSVLSHPDICVLALTHTLHGQAKKQESEQQKNDVPTEASFAMAFDYPMLMLGIVDFVGL
jgi:RNA-binding protein NOB1